jgi:hypothetical protein
MRPAKQVNVLAGLRGPGRLCRDGHTVKHLAAGQRIGLLADHLGAGIRVGPSVAVLASHDPLHASVAVPHVEGCAVVLGLQHVLHHADVAHQRLR